jgi:hypothetical protein
MLHVISRSLCFQGYDSLALNLCVGITTVQTSCQKLCIVTTMNIMVCLYGNGLVDSVVVCMS